MAAPERPPVYADENVDRFLTDALRRRGFEVLTTREAGRLGTSDEQQLAYAAAVGAVLLTHDRADFHRLHRTWQEGGRAHAGIAILPQRGSVSIRAMRAALLLDWLATGIGPSSRLVVWGDLQAQALAELRLEGYREHEVRLALGVAEA